jgi:hypothetical protein
MEKRGKKNFTTPAANVVVMVATKASGVSRKREKEISLYFQKIYTFRLFDTLIFLVQGWKQYEIRICISGMVLKQQR